jgi:hypothetical protein
MRIWRTSAISASLHGDSSSLTRSFEATRFVAVVDAVFAAVLLALLVAVLAAVLAAGVVAVVLAPRGAVVELVVTDAFLVVRGVRAGRGEAAGGAAVFLPVVGRDAAALAAFVVELGEAALLAVGLAVLAAALLVAALFDGALFDGALLDGARLAAALFDAPLLDAGLLDAGLLDGARLAAALFDAALFVVGLAVGRAVFFAVDEAGVACAPVDFAVFVAAFLPAACFVAALAGAFVAAALLGAAFVAAALLAAAFLDGVFVAGALLAAAFLDGVFVALLAFFAGEVGCFVPGDVARVTAAATDDTVERTAEPTLEAAFLAPPLRTDVLPDAALSATIGPSPFVAHAVDVDKWGRQ